MCRNIIQPFGKVVPAAYNLSVANHQGTNRDFIFPQCRFRFLQSQFHKKIIRRNYGVICKTVISHVDFCVVKTVLKAKLSFIRNFNRFLFISLTIKSIVMTTLTIRVPEGSAQKVSSFIEGLGGEVVAAELSKEELRQQTLEELEKGLNEAFDIIEGKAERKSLMQA